MAFSFFNFIRPRNGTTASVEVTCKELFEAAQDLKVRELCFNICVNMVANAIGRCDFRTFRYDENTKKSVEVQGTEHYLWNIEPNINQNSTAFLHKLVAKLYSENEVLIISTKRRDGQEALVVADSFTRPEKYPSKQNEYRDVVVGKVEYSKTFREEDVLHLQLNNTNIKPVIDGMNDAFVRLYNAATEAYRWEQGQHWKVHVGQMAQGTEEFTTKFAQMITDQVKPFLTSGGAVLPEFDGYEYQNVGGGKSGTTPETRDIRALVEDIFDFTARGFLIPAVLVNGKVEGTENANTRFLTNCVDPICDQLQEEIIRKRYGYNEWKKGNYIRVDSSAIIHFDLFDNAANVEKLVGSGAFSINDILRAAGQATINEPWADKHYLTLNIEPMEKATRALDAQKGGST